MSSIHHCCLGLSSKPQQTPKFYKYKQVRAQAFEDEGRLMNIVDKNMEVLRGRIENVRVRERLQRGEQYGWYLSPGYDYSPQKNTKLSVSLELMVRTCLAFGFTVATSSVLLYIASIVIH